MKGKSAKSAVLVIAVLFALLATAIPAAAASGTSPAELNRLALFQKANPEVTFVSAKMRPIEAVPAALAAAVGASDTPATSANVTSTEAWQLYRAGERSAAAPAALGGTVSGRTERAGGHSARVERFIQSEPLASGVTFVPAGEPERLYAKGAYWVK